MDVAIAMKNFLTKYPTLALEENRQQAKLFEYIFSHAEEIWGDLLNQPLTMISFCDAMLVYAKWAKENELFKSKWGKIFEVVFGMSIDGLISDLLVIGYTNTKEEWSEAFSEITDRTGEQQLMASRMMIDQKNQMYKPILRMELTVGQFLETRSWTVTFN